jgi:Phage tail protein (Tail_P2_I)
MPRPEASPAAEELYAALAPVQEAADEASGEWIGLKVCMALVAGKIDLLHQILIDDVDDLAAWEVVFDPLRCPAEFLPYLAQFDGAIFRPDMDEEGRRNAIRAPEAFARGRLSSIEAVAKRRLTGTKTVVVTERYTGDAWKLRVETLASETPEPAETKREIVEFQKPIGIVLFFNTRTPWTWGEVKAESKTFPTWASVKTAFPTWKDLRTHEP